MDPHMSKEIKRHLPIDLAGYFIRVPGISKMYVTEAYSAVTGVQCQVKLATPTSGSITSKETLL